MIVELVIDLEDSGGDIVDAQVASRAAKSLATSGSGYCSEEETIHRYVLKDRKRLIRNTWHYGLLFLRGLETREISYIWVGCISHRASSILRSVPATIRKSSRIPTSTCLAIKWTRGRRLHGGAEGSTLNSETHSRSHPRCCDRQRDSFLLNSHSLLRPFD